MTGYCHQFKYSLKSIKFFRYFNHWFKRYLGNLFEDWYPSECLDFILNWFWNLLSYYHFHDLSFLGFHFCFAFTTVNHSRHRNLHHFQQYFRRNDQNTYLDWLRMAHSSIIVNHSLDHYWNFMANYDESQNLVHFTNQLLRSH